MAHPLETPAISRRAPSRPAGKSSRLPGRTGRGVAAVASVWLGALAALPGCEPWVIGNGVFKEETRPVAPFTAVSVQDGIEVQVAAGSAQRSLKVSGDENVLEHVKTSVKSEASGPTLVVESDILNLETTLPLLVTVTTPALVAATATEDAILAVTGVAGPDFAVTAASGAAVTLAGAGGEHILVTLSGGEGGGATLDARSYIVNTAEVTLSGGSLAQLHVDGLVTGTASERSTIENLGEGTCQVVASGGSTVACGN